jgi:hypothetical protein
VKAPGNGRPRTPSVKLDVYGHLWPGRIDEVGERMGHLFE